MSTLHQPRIYRVSTGNLVIGLLTMLLFGCQLWAPLTHLVTGTPMEMRSGRSPATSITYMSTPGQLGMLVVCWGVFCLLSLILILQWVNGYVVADEAGVCGRNIFGLTSFQAAWSEIDRVELKTGYRTAGTYIIHAGNQRLKLTSFPEAGELLHLVQERCPHIRVE